jgi:glutamate racemase
MGYNKIGVFATEGTVKSNAYKSEILKYNPNITVNEVACPNWVSIVEGVNSSINIKQDIETHMIEMLSFNPDKINIGIFNPIELNQLYELFKDKFQFVIVETLADENTRYLRSLDRLKPYDKEGLKELCRRNQADEEDFKIIKYVPRFSLNTTEPFAGLYNEGFMDAVVKLLGEYD